MSIIFTVKRSRRECAYSRPLPSCAKSRNMDNILKYNQYSSDQCVRQDLRAICKWDDYRSLMLLLRIAFT